MKYVFFSKETGELLRSVPEFSPDAEDIHNPEVFAAQAIVYTNDSTLESDFTPTFDERLGHFVPVHKQVASPVGAIAVRIL